MYSNIISTVKHPMFEQGGIKMAFFKGEVYSYALGKMVPLDVYLPYDDNRRFKITKPTKTLILLHGLGGNYSYWHRFSSIERYAQQRNLAIIMPDADMSMYTDMKCGQNYEKYIAIELKEIISNLFRLNTSRDNYFIAGLSMGGYGALKLAIKYPEEFGKCASFSGAFMIGSRQHLNELSQWSDPGESDIYDENYEITKNFQIGYKGSFGEDFTYREKDDLFLVTERAAESNIKLPEILMTCGTEDFVFNDNLRYCGHLDELDIPYQFYKWNGVHEWSFWDESIRKYISFFD